MKVLAFVAISALAMHGASGQAKSQPGQAAGQAAIRHVTVVDVVTGAETPEQTVRIAGGKIVAIAPTLEADAGLAGAVDGKGGYLIPGLWDMHVHVHDTMELPLYVANGVVGVRVMSGAQDEAAYRAALTDVAVGPRIYLASAIVDGPSPMWPGSYVVKHAEDVRKTVDAIEAGGADFIKVYDGIPRDAYFALAAEAKAKAIPFEGHVPEAVSVQEASDAGQRSVEHLTGMAVGCSTQQSSLMSEMEQARFFRDRLLVEAKGMNSLDQAKCQALFAELKKNETWQVPTLTVLRMWGRLDDAKYGRDPRLVYMDRRSVSRWEDRVAPQMRRWGGAEWQMARGLFAADERMVRAMAAAGVKLMAGTDAGNPYCLPGFGLHDELKLLVESGLTPLGALQLATVNPAKFMGKAEEMGTVAVGKDADLVLLRADPLKDIGNVDGIAGVWVGGRYFEPAALDSLLEKAKLEARR